MGKQAQFNFQFMALLYLKKILIALYSPCYYLLAELGYGVEASTRRVEQANFLKKLGTKDVIDRNILSEPGRPLAKTRWAGEIDTEGRYTLSNACAGLQYDVVATCGLARGMELTDIPY
jgi:acrylyl-CoA reductase (NADPH)